MTATSARKVAALVIAAPVALPVLLAWHLWRLLWDGVFGWVRIARDTFKGNA